MWSSSSRRVLQELLSLRAVRGFRGTAAQNTVVVERWWQVPLSKVGSPPRLNPRRHRIYKVVEDKKHSPQEKMELILTETVPKLGGRGDTVYVKKSVGRNKLLAQGLAVYPSPENKQMFSEELRLLQEGRPEERSQTRTGQLTVEFLRGSKLKLGKMPCEEYQLTKDIVIRQLAKKLGVVAQPHTVNFPFESAKDVGEYWCEITVNGLDTVRLPISVLPYEEMSAKKQKAVANAAETVADVSSAASNAAETVADVSSAAADSAETVADVSASMEATADVSVATEVAGDIAAAVEAEANVTAATETAVADDSTAKAAADATAADIAAEEKNDGVLKAVSDASLQAEGVKEAAGKSADEETAAPAKTAQDTTAPASENPEKK